MKNTLAAAIIAAIAMTMQGMLVANSVVPSPDSLERLFDAPPQSRGANAWWHWQGANVTKSGITRDLEAMKD
ncbi:MAG: hypothetical protein IKU71_08935, partial [Kiritimatiellae bacterium]|nr:hypothetical protein [Kiritimatiellia bacterium]